MRLLPLHQSSGINLTGKINESALTPANPKELELLFNFYPTVQFEREHCQVLAGVVVFFVICARYRWFEDQR
jgi:hypothetical protein